MRDTGKLVRDEDGEARGAHRLLAGRQGQAGRRSSSATRPAASRSSRRCSFQSAIRARCRHRPWTRSGQSRCSTRSCKASPRSGRAWPSSISPASPWWTRTSRTRSSSRRRRCGLLGPRWCRRASAPTKAGRGRRGSPRYHHARDAPSGIGYAMRRGARQGLGVVARRVADRRARHPAARGDSAVVETACSTALTHAIT